MKVTGMKNRKFILWFTGLVLLFSGCTGNSSERSARLQVLSMVPASEAIITIQPVQGEGGFYRSINYAEPTGYNEFKPGRYNISFIVDGTTVLDHTYVLGKNSYQTLLVAGMMPDSLRTNPQTFWFSVSKIFAGSESTNRNGFMPQFKMLRDGYGGSKTKGAVRFINASPLAPTLYAKSSTAGFKHLITYPKETEPSILKLKPTTIHFLLEEILLDSLELEPEKGQVQTVIVGNSSASDSLLKISQYSTPHTNN